MEKEITQKELVALKPDQIAVEKEFNVRLERNYGDIDGLAQSIVLIGLQQPLQGFQQGKKFILTDGHRRFKAIQLAIQKNKEGKDPVFKNIKRIAKIDFLTGDAEMESRLLTMLTTGEGKKELTEGEKMIAYSRLVELGEKANRKKTDIINEIVKMTGSSQASVYSILQLNTLPKTVKEKVEQGKISGNTASHLSRQIKGDDKKLEKVVSATIKNAEKRAVKEGKSKSEAKATVADTKGLVTGQTPQQRIKELLEELAIEQVHTERAKFFRTVMNHIDNKMQTKQLVKLFQD